MALSGSTDLAITRDEIITEALELLGVIHAGATPAAADITSCAKSLNYIVKWWATLGVGLWKNKEVVVFQSYEGYEYDVGPSGDNATSSYVKTEVATAGDSGDTNIVVDSITGILDADYIGIELDDNTLQWSTVNGTPSGSTVELDDALTDDVAVDNHIYTYTTIIDRPLTLSNERLVHADNTETMLTSTTRDEYMTLTDKTNTGTPNTVYYDRQLTNGKLYVWPACSDVQKLIKFTARVQFEDFDASTNNPDFPQDWFFPLTTNLAVIVAPKFRAPVTQELMMMATASFEEVKNFDREFGSIKFGVTV